MRFALGYQMADPGEESIVDLVADYRDHVAEVYFPWPGMPSGRAALTDHHGDADGCARQRLEADLLALRDMGVALDLLFNANCYGADAVSIRLQDQVTSIMDHLDRLVGGVQTVTTTSLAVARTLKRHFPAVEVRASVNMRLGTPAAMEYVAGLFDGYYVQRDHNRDLAHLRRLARWAQAHGKRLYLLANSGCLAFCPGQTFHDNLVAHDHEIGRCANIPGWSPLVCWHLLRKPDNWPAILQGTWIRPEDLHHYDGMFDVVKLATRMHARPRLVLDAYVRRRCHGNLLDLFEPGFSPAVAPFIFDNDRFPADWFDHTSACGRRCETCTWCRDVLDQVLVNMHSHEDYPRHAAID